MLRLPNPEITKSPNHHMHGSAHHGVLWVWGPAVAMLAAIFFLSSLSEPPSPPGDLSDRGLHTLEYAVLGGLMLRAVAGARWTGVTLWSALGAFVLSTAYGITDEVHQYFVPGRESDVGDVAVDTLGSALAAAALWGWSLLRDLRALRALRG
jgi:VanZ family protein